MYSFGTSELTLLEIRTKNIYNSGLQMLQTSSIRMTWKTEEHSPGKRDLPWHSPIEWSRRFSECIFAFRQQFKTVSSVFSDVFQNVSLTPDRPILASHQLELCISQTNKANHGWNSVKTQTAKKWNIIIHLLLKRERKEEGKWKLFPQNLHGLG